MDKLVDGIMSLVIALMAGGSIVVLAGVILLFYSMHPYLGVGVTIFVGIPCVYIVYNTLRFLVSSGD